MNHDSRTSTVHATIESRLGTLTLVRQQDVYIGLHFASAPALHNQSLLGPPSRDGFEEAETQVSEYLSGTRLSFTIPFAAAGDPFERCVWDRISRIEFGQTVTYNGLAAELGDPATPRRIRAAVARNPLRLLVPCHRISNSNDEPLDYPAGNARQRILLDVETEVLTMLPMMYITI